MPRRRDYDYLRFAREADEAARWLLAHASSLRSVRAEGYPSSRGAALRFRARLAASANTYVRNVGTSGFEQYARDQESAAHLRTTAVMLDALATWRTTGALADAGSARRDRALVDPFTGSPLRVRTSPRFGTITIWSVGPNGRDDHAEADDIVSVAMLAPAATPAPAGLPVSPTGGAPSTAPR